MGKMGRKLRGESFHTKIENRTVIAERSKKVSSIGLQLGSDRVLAVGQSIFDW